MERPDYIALYTCPADYKPPEELRHDTQYPNMNSKDYRKKPINRTPKILPYFEKLITNKESDVFLLATNDIRSRIWNGYIWGFSNVDAIGDQEKAIFKIHSNSTVLNMLFTDNNIFAMTQANGSVQLWSTKSTATNPNEYCLFMIGEKSEHLGLVLGLDLMKADNSKIVTSCSEGCLKVWDIGSADLFSIHTIRIAHSDSITGISSSSEYESVFATCSRDRSALLWDYRQPRPATALFENHSHDFTTINWMSGENSNDFKISGENSNDGKICLGDESGKIIIVDPKMPNSVLSNINAFSRPIRKIEFRGNKMAVISNSNCIKVFNKKEWQFNSIYKNIESENYIRDFLWRTYKEILSVGWDSKCKKHVWK